MTGYRKKLIEVALPLKAINEESARRKRKAPAGYPTTIHKWWAQRPIAACRAVLFASLVDDPDSDPAYQKADGTVDEDRAGIKRAQLFNLIEELVLWENSNNPRVINAARAEIARCVASRKIELGELGKDTIIFGENKVQQHPKGPVSGDGTTAWEIVLMKARPEIVNAFLAEYAPPVLDPFCGGGSIPLEAQRLGLRAYGSDLNPVPVLITKAMIEIPSRFAGRAPVNPEWQTKSKAEKAATLWSAAQGLAEDLRYYSGIVRAKLEAEIGNEYPPILVDDALVKARPDLREYLGQRLPTVAWLWARTVRSSDPSVHGAFVPLVTTFRLRSKGDQKVWIEPDVDKAANTYRFTVKTGRPTQEQARIAAQGTKTGRGANFKCLLSGSPLDEAYIRTQCENHETGICLLAVVAEGKGRSRVYLPPTDEHFLAAVNCQAPSWVPDQPMDQKCADLVSGRGYGFTCWSELFTRRQLLVHSTLCRIIQETQELISQHAKVAGFSSDSSPLADDGSGADAYGEALGVFLSFAMIRSIDYSSAFSSWRHKDSALRSTLAKQAIPMVWDFAEANPFNKSSGGFLDCANVVAKCLELLPASPAGTVTQLDATEAVLNLHSPVVCCDPPYYSNISYAELSDFLYVWLRRALFGTFQKLFSTLLTPKTRELVAATHRHDGDGDAAKSFFEQGLRAAFSQMRKGANQECPVTIFYAFKQTEEDEEGDDNGDTVEGAIASTGWETMLDALITSGFQISGTWPMRTEGDNRQVGVGRNALASSIVLVCRPRPATAPLATRKEFMNTLRRDLPEALKNLQHGNIAPVDMAQAAIGPGMGVFTRYAKVVESDGSCMTVRTALGIINQVLDEVLAEQEGDFDADTRWAVSWFEQFGMQEESFGTAETLSRAKNTAINGLVEAGIVKAKAGKVRLVRREELPENWNPATDKRLTVWETTQHLIHTLQTKGEAEAALLLNQLGGMGEVARELAYRLFSICERKKWADEALAYNSLVIAWPELSKLALSTRNRQSTTQAELFS